MWKQSVWSSTISAKVANKHLKSGGILVLPGAAPASAGTPGMIGYGMAKAAVHQLTKSLAEPKSGMPENSRVNFSVLYIIGYWWIPQDHFGLVYNIFTFLHFRFLHYCPSHWIHQ